MSYYLAFFGRPFPGTLRIASNADLSYMAFLQTGFMPAVNKRTFTAEGLISSFSAISEIVKYSFAFNFITKISDILAKNLKNTMIRYAYVMRNLANLAKNGLLLHKCYAIFITFLKKSYKKLDLLLTNNLTNSKINNIKAIQT